jgi:hypothetical protein
MGMGEEEDVCSSWAVWMRPPLLLQMLAALAVELVELSRL